MKVLLTWQAHEAEIDRVARALPAGTEVVAHPGMPAFSRFDASLSASRPTRATPTS
ncbi:MAG: hypothetical protein U5K43_13585 [Halofilum sp. (in: g-proteobacteria)]|nr:hypothetical protein [Halofilum sp. (in: g-proteobacteria)]